MQRAFSLGLVFSVAALTIGCASIPSSTYQNGAAAGIYGAGDNSYYGGGLFAPGRSGRTAPYAVAPVRSTTGQGGECNEPSRAITGAQTEPANADSQAGVTGKKADEGSSSSPAEPAGAPETADSAETAKEAN